MTDIGWNFPPNNYGRKEMLNDSGIAGYAGTPYDSLAREVIQNSLDAALPENTAPVQVHFSLHNVQKSKFPGADEFEEILHSCKKEQPDNEKSQKILNSAIDLLQMDEVPTLVVSDYNTTGLLGSNGKGKQNDWDNLVKSSGASDKIGSKGGSYGIGKNATFACSKLRIVCYSTKDYENNVAFQGVSILMSHKNSRGKETRGTGFYGKKKKNEPIYDMNNLDPFFQRTQVGTTLYIFGFIQSEDWESEIINSVLENYFVAIHEGRLSVKVGDTFINSTSLPELLERHLSDSNEFLAPKFYQAMISPNTHPFVENDFFGMGKVELYILPEKNYPKRVAIVRGTGMKVFNKGNVQTPIQFAGVFLARGEGINQFMRELEDPSHSQWQPYRHDNVAYAKRMITKIYAWINQQVKSIAVENDLDEIDVQWLSKYLPDDSDDFEPELPEHQEGIEDGPPKDVEIRIIEPEHSFDSVAEGGEESGLGGGKDGSILGNGEKDDGGGDSKGAQPTEPDVTEKNTGGPGNGAINPDMEEEKMSSYTNRSNLLKKVRLFSVDSDRGEYRLNYLSDFSGNGYLKIKTVGDDGSREPAPILKVTELESGEAVEFGSDGRIGPILFKKEARGSLQIVLKDGLRCAMEVSANAT